MTGMRLKKRSDMHAALPECVVLSSPAQLQGTVLYDCNVHMHVQELYVVCVS